MRTVKYKTYHKLKKVSMHLVDRHDLMVDKLIELIKMTNSCVIEEPVMQPLVAQRMIDDQPLGGNEEVRKVHTKKGLMTFKNDSEREKMIDTIKQWKVIKD